MIFGENSEEMLKQMEKDAAAEQKKIADAEENPDDDENLEEDGEEDTTEGEGDEDEAGKEGEDGEDEPKDGEDEGGEEENLGEAANSEDPKKRNGAFGRMRHEQKELRKQLEDERKEKQQLAERVARMEGRLEATPQPKAEEKKDEDPEPDGTMYPEDHLAWENRQLRKENQAISKRLEPIERETTYNREVRGVQALEQQFKTAKPTEAYDDAVQFLVDRERKLKKLQNPTLSDAQIEGQIQVEKVQFFKNTYAQGGKNPAEMVMEIAKLNGFVPAKGKKPGHNGGKVDLKKVADTQRRATNLIGGSAASKSNGKVTSDNVLNMSFQSLLKNSNKPGFFDGIEE